MIWSSVELDQCNKVGNQGNSANSLTSHVNIFVISWYDKASTIPFDIDSRGARMTQLIQDNMFNYRIKKICKEAGQRASISLPHVTASKFCYIFFPDLIKMFFVEAHTSCM
jgi:hypothetical protein